MRSFLIPLALLVVGVLVALFLFHESPTPQNGAVTINKSEPAPPAPTVAEPPDLDVELAPSAQPNRAADAPVIGKNGEPLATLHGRVVDAISEKPIKGFQMWCANASEGNLDSVLTNPHRMNYFNNPLGTFTYKRLEAGRYNLVVRIDGYQELITRDVLVPMPTQDFVLRLSRGAFIEGVVTNLDGDTLSDIEVRLNPVKLDDPEHGPRTGLAYTDLDGHYLFSDLPTGVYIVALANPDLGAAPSQEIYLGLGAHFPVNFQIREHNTLVVTVIDSSGHAIVGAHVRLFAERENDTTIGKAGAALAQRGDTDETGEASIKHVPAGSYKLKVYSAGFLRKDVDVAVTTAEEEVPLSVTLEIDPNAKKDDATHQPPAKPTPEELKALQDPERFIKPHGKPPTKPTGGG